MGISPWMLMACTLVYAFGTCVLALLIAFAIAAIRFKRSSKHRTRWSSCLYEGRVKHFRWHVAKHGFEYPIFFVYMDVDEVHQLEEALWPLFGTSWSMATLNSTDHLKHDNAFDKDLSHRIRAHVHKDIGIRPGGPIRLLTHLQYLGYCFNPVSFYYLFDEADSKVEGVVAEVSNTPWIEMHCYTLHPANKHVKCTLNASTATWNYQFDKNFHVSPFMDMTYIYDWTFAKPSSELTATTNMMKVQPSSAKATEQSSLHFSASVRLQRVEFSPWSLMRVLLCYPMQTILIQVYIHYEAFRLWFKSVPVYPHPQGTETSASRLIWFFMKPLFELQDYFHSKYTKAHNA